MSNKCSKKCCNDKISGNNVIINTDGHENNVIINTNENNIIITTANERYTSH